MTGPDDTSFENTGFEDTGFEVVGHAEQQAILRALNARALLFTGPERVGRRRTARWYAALLNCRQPEQAPCGRCSSCRLAAQNLHPDYREVAPTATTREGRSSRKPELRIAQLVPREGEAPDDALSRWLEAQPRFAVRVGLIDQAETLTRSAANAFLKMLEEPPGHARIVLVAPSPSAVLPTIASRCAVLRFGTVTPAALGTSGALEHPNARLGRYGELRQAEAEPDAFAERLGLVDGYLRALEQGLESALEAADGLEKRWLEESPFGLDDLLLARFAAWPAVRYAAAADALARFQDALAAYASAGLALHVLTLELREILAQVPD